MGDKVIKVYLTPESIGECRSGPSRILLLAVSEAKPGDKIIVDGLDDIIPLNFVKDLLESEGFNVEKTEHDPPLYHIEALKTS